MDRFILYPLFLASLAVIGFLAWQLFEYATALPTWEAALTRTTASLDTANREISSLQQDSAQLRADVAAVTTAQQSTAQELEIYRNVLAEANYNVNQANATIQEQEQWLKATRDLLNTVDKEKNAALLSLDVERKSLAEENQMTQRQAITIAELESDLRSKDSQITRQNTQINEQKAQISSQNTTISRLGASLSYARSQEVRIPDCSTKYYTSINGQLYCVSRRTAAAPNTQGESRDIDLPQTGPVTLKIYRSGEQGSEQSMAILEHAVRTIEEYMGQPIPLQGREIRLDFVEEIKGGWAGVHKGTHMEILQKYESGRPWQRDRLGSIIAHEVAHYYWAGDRDWLDEGAADFLELYSENRRTGAPIRAKNRRCYQVSNISQLESQRYEQDDAGFRCNYSLGEGLFVDLYNAMSATEFRQSFRELYNSGKNKLTGVHQVRQAYYYSSAWAIIDQWYGYREKPEAHWLNGEFLGFYTWKERGELVLPPNRSGQPCATRLRRNDQSTRGGYYFQTRNECHYTGTWSDEGDLLVTINGTTYRAVDVQVRQPFRYVPTGSVHPGNSIPSPTVIPLRRQL